jgi:hypothetical protein
MADPEWYVGKGGEQKGPFTQDDVNGMISRGELGARDLVWKEGMDEWVAAADLEEFAEPLKATTEAEAKPVEIPGAEWLKSFWADLRAILVAPDEGLDAVADKKPLCFALVWVGLGVLIYALLRLQMFCYVGGVLRAAEAGGGPSGVGVFFRALAQGIIFYAIWFGALLLTLNAILKTEATWQDSVSILGLSSIPTASVGLVIFVFAWLTPYVYVLGPLALSANVLILHHVFVHTSKVSRRVALYAVPALYLGSFLVFGLLGLLAWAVTG